MKNLTQSKMLEAIKYLDDLIASRTRRLDSKEVTLILGGGGAMILAHNFPLGTSDVDAIPKGMDLLELDPLIKKTAKALELEPDWLNPYFSTFSHTLPSDYGCRLIEVFSGRGLKVQALGKEDLLIMKCFAHRQKDVAHAKALLKRGADTAFVEKHIEALKQKGIPGAREALDFLDDVVDQL